MAPSAADTTSPASTSSTFTDPSPLMESTSEDDNSTDALVVAPPIRRRRRRRPEPHPHAERIGFAMLSATIVFLFLLWKTQCVLDSIEESGTFRMDHLLFQKAEAVADWQSAAKELSQHQGED